MAVITKECSFCKEMHSVTVPDEGLEKYRMGELVQRAFPGLTPVEREILLSGTCGPCWDTYMVSPEDEEMEEGGWNDPDAEVENWPLSTLFGGSDGPE